MVLNIPPVAPPGFLWALVPVSAPPAATRESTTGRRVVVVSELPTRPRDQMQQRIKTALKTVDLTEMERRRRRTGISFPDFHDAIGLKTDDRQERNRFGDALAFGLNRGDFDLPEFVLGAGSCRGDRGRVQSIVVVRKAKDGDYLARKNVNRHTPSDRVEAIIEEAIQNSSWNKTWLGLSPANLQGLVLELATHHAIAFPGDAFQAMTTAMRVVLDRRSTWILRDGVVEFTKVQSAGKRLYIVSQRPS